MDDKPVILDIDPSSTFPGSEAVARLRPGGLSDWSMSRGMKGDRPWCIRLGRTWLGESPGVRVPIRFSITDQLGELLIEAYQSIALGVRHHVIAQGRIRVFKSSDEMLRSAIINPNRGDGLADFNDLCKRWVDERTRREELSNLLAPYFCDEQTVDRAFEFSFQLYSNVLKRIAFGCVKQDSDDLVQQLYKTAWEARHDYDPDRGSFKVWIHNKLRGCRSDYLKKESRERKLLAKLYKLLCGNSNLDDETKRLVMNEEYLANKIARLEKRFPRQEVEMFLCRKTEFPKPTYLQIADQFGYRPELNPAARALAVKRVIDKIENYAKNYLKGPE